MSCLSVFKPSNKRFYQVTDFTKKKEEMYKPTVSSTPIVSLKIAQSPSPNSAMKMKRIKKKWNATLKKIAVAKAKEIGLTKATRFLQVTYPNEYAELSPSTLQYWIQKCDA